VARKAESLGAGEICLNSIDADGTKEGYELTLTRKVSEAVGVPVIASGGAGIPKHLVDVLREGKADAALVASMVHFGRIRLLGLRRIWKRLGGGATGATAIIGRANEVVIAFSCCRFVSLLKCFRFRCQSLV